MSIITYSLLDEKPLLVMRTNSNRCHCHFTSTNKFPGVKKDLKDPIASDHCFLNQHDAIKSVFNNKAVKLRGMCVKSEEAVTLLSLIKVYICGTEPQKLMKNKIIWSLIIVTAYVGYCLPTIKPARFIRFVIYRHI